MNKDISINDRILRCKQSILMFNDGTEYGNKLVEHYKNELQWLEQLKEYIKDNEFTYTIGEFQSEIIIKTCDLLGESKVE